ncbi:MAG: hypothetical protein ACO3UU_13590 [Minisyncoccia bacterium]
MARLADLYLTYQFVTRLITPFDQWDAFKLGIISSEGKVLKKRKTLNTEEEKRAWGYFDIVAANVKKLITKLPGGDSKLMTYAATGLLMREEYYQLDEEYIEKIVEDLVNVVGQGKVAGLGVGDQGEPGVKKKKKEIIASMVKRKLP